MRVENVAYGKSDSFFIVIYFFQYDEHKYKTNTKQFFQNRYLHALEESTAIGNRTLHLYEFATDSIPLCHLQVQVKNSSLLVGYQFLYFRHLTITP